MEIVKLPVFLARSFISLFSVFTYAFTALLRSLHPDTQFVSISFLRGAQEPLF